MACCDDGQQKQWHSRSPRVGSQQWEGLRNTMSKLMGFPAIMRHEMGAATDDAAAQRRAEGDSPIEMQLASDIPYWAPGAGCDVP